MPARGERCRIAASEILLSSLLLIVLAWAAPASGQMAVIDLSQSDLTKVSPDAQAAILTAGIAAAWKDNKCTGAKVSLEKTFTDKAGGWLVQCREGKDYWALVSDRPKAATIVLPCTLARQSGTDCYANIKTATSEDIDQCAPRSDALDRVIRSCTAIIQSRRFDSNAAGLSLAHTFRALALASYQQLDLAIADFDRALVLQPDQIDTRYNRAVALERKGELDQALSDLAKVIQSRPEDINALHERGYVLLKKGDHDRAIADFDHVLRINPQFDKAIRNRAKAIKAKDSTQPGSNVVAAEIVPGPKTADEQAAYCMEASFGYAQQLGRLLPILRDNRSKGRAVLEANDVPPTERTKIAAAVAELDDSITLNDQKKKTWDSHLNVYIAYMQKRNVFGNSAVIAAMSGKARDDQQAVQNTYRACLRDCRTGDAACRTVCNQKAEVSEANTRMSRCADITGDFK